MKAVGVIVEYNPFHNGHAHHLQAAREAADTDVVIAVMSGNFLQRGEPALVSKWCRTQMALLGGVDLVFELPYPFAVQKAETFAHGAVSILAAAGCDSLCFGSESGDISSFLETIDFLSEHGQSFEENIKQFIDTGVSYPKALALAYQQLPHSEKYLDLSKPNNILGFQYIKAIMQQRSSLTPLTVKRKSADYHDEHFASETIASATSIRKAIFSNDTGKNDIGRFVPTPAMNLLKEYFQRYGFFHEWENYWCYLQFRIIHSAPLELREIYDVEEGLENRLKAAALESNSFAEFMEKLKTKRYTWTRLQRLCTHILTNTKKNEMSGFPEKVSYLRLLGMTAQGKNYLNKMKKHLNLPLVAKLSSFKSEEIVCDIRAAQTYAMAFPNSLKAEMLKQEFTQPPIRVE